MKTEPVKSVLQHKTAPESRCNNTSERNNQTFPVSKTKNEKLNTFIWVTFQILIRHSSFTNVTCTSCIVTKTNHSNRCNTNILVVIMRQNKISLGAPNPNQWKWNHVWVSSVKSSFSVGQVTWGGGLAAIFWSGALVDVTQTCRQSTEKLLAGTLEPGQTLSNSVKT